MLARVKSIDSLMKYLRDNHNISISGSLQKRKLRNIGYYHGYKGYRYISTPNQKIPYTDFNQVLAVNAFDMELKALFYSHIMFIETALKNYVLESVLNQGRTENFNTIYETQLLNYKNHPYGSDQYTKALNQRLRLREKFYNTLNRDYSNNKQVVKHFYHKDEPVPIWAIFEVISLGEFGNFVSCASNNIKREVSLSLNLNQSCDANGKLTENIIYLIKDLRNSVAHNDVIFDTRFRSNRPNHAVISCLQLDTRISNINFNTIVDYLILIVYLLKNLSETKTELNRLVTKFEVMINAFRNQIPINVYNQVFHTDTRNKLNLLKIFIRK